jgi:hypothetical protein
MLLVTLALAACERGGRGPPPERFVPASAGAAILLPELGRAATSLAALQRSLSGLPGAGDRVEWRRSLAEQLGFDPLDPEALMRAGLDPKRGAALAIVPAAGGALPGRGAALLVLPVSHGTDVAELLSRLARDRLGATERTTSSANGVATTSFRRPGEPSPALSFAIVERTALVATGADGSATVAAAAALAPSAALASDAGFARARAALGGGLVALAWSPPGSAALPAPSGLADGVALGVGPSAGLLVARIAVLPGAHEPALRALAAADRGESGRARLVAGVLDPLAPLVVRWNGDFAALGRILVPRLPASDREALTRAKVDLERDLFGVLRPGGAAAISLAPQIVPGSLSLDAVRRDPLGSVEFEAVVPVGPGADAAVARLAHALAGRSVRPEPGGIARIRTRDGELAWRFDGERIAVAGGKHGRLDALLDRLAAGRAGWRPPTESSGTALERGLGGAVLDVPRLVAAIRALPDDAYGGGPSGFVARSLVARMLAPADAVTAVSLRAELAEGALVVTLEVEPSARVPR